MKLIDNNFLDFIDDVADVGSTMLRPTLKMRSLAPLV